MIRLLSSGGMLYGGSFVVWFFVFSEANEAVTLFSVFAYFERCLCLSMPFVCGVSVISHSLQLKKKFGPRSIPPHIVFYHFRTKK
jgi:hypothetical protein